MNVFVLYVEVDLAQGLSVSVQEDRGTGQLEPFYAFHGCRRLLAGVAITFAPVRLRLGIVEEKVVVWRRRVLRRGDRGFGVAYFHTLLQKNDSSSNCLKGTAGSGMTDICTKNQITMHGWKNAN